MDNETFDMLDIAKSEIEEQMKFVKENDVCKVMSYKGNVFGVEPPTFVELEVVDTEPGFAGTHLQMLQSLLLLKQVLQFKYLYSLI